MTKFTTKVNFLTIYIKNSRFLRGKFFATLIKRSQIVSEIKISHLSIPQLQDLIR